MDRGPTASRNRESVRLAGLFWANTGSGSGYSVEKYVRYNVKKIDKKELRRKKKQGRNFLTT